ncbi:MAG: hypothetical protein ACRCUB_00550, partial [Plesiomonas shigelloides]
PLSQPERAITRHTIIMRFIFTAASLHLTLNAVTHRTAGREQSAESRAIEFTFSWRTGYPLRRHLCSTLYHPNGVSTD